ncbi:MAG: orotidine-5'-phosphate decarboxylase [Burkholderia sp.]|nr:orotidine-5'-phosphate decarboxylase [Burkholderia sp.]
MLEPISFIDSLHSSWQRTNSLLCVGLDPEPIHFPEQFSGQTDAIFEFCRQIVDATAEYVSAFKPQIAYFSAYRAECQLEQLISYIHLKYPGVPVILDAKRGDICSTAEKYAREAFERYHADALTVNPYMGFDSFEPYFAYSDRGVIALCRTSNIGGADLQLLEVNGRPIYQIVAELAATKWNAKTGQFGLVVGGTFPKEIEIVRRIIGNMPILIPGVGAQGARIKEVVFSGKTSDGVGMIINSSRAILYAGKGENFKEAAALAAKKMRDIINTYRCF